MPDYRAETRRAAQRHGLDPGVFERQIQQESGFNPNARSPAGALGIAQIMPATARGWGVDPMNPRQALDAAASNMARYVKQYGGYENALRAYNAGPGAIERSKAFAETNHYVATILGGKTPKSTPSRTPARSADPQGSDSRTTTTTTTTPGVDNRGARGALVSAFLGQKSADPLAFAMQMNTLRDVAPTSQVDTQTQRTPSTRPQRAPSSSPASGGHGAFSVSGPNPGRLQPHLTAFAKKVADQLGMHLVGLDGSTHSKMTTTGNVSQHYSGQATDIFTINGKSLKQNQGLLLQAGRAALIAAGMPRAKAMKAPFGLYNEGGHQIIFGTNSRALGGDHTDHLHISAV